MGVGQDHTTYGLSHERVAINLADETREDNAGGTLTDATIAEDGPSAYFSTVPVKAMADAMREAGFPADTSLSAGSFVCNHLMYSMLHDLATEDENGIRAGSVHVPLAPEQAVEREEEVPSISVADITEALEVAFETLARELN